MISLEICRFVNYCFEYERYDPPLLCDGRCGDEADLEKDIEKAKRDEGLKKKIEDYYKYKANDG